jgi:3-methyladenine DNA glycosylase AlkD
VRKTKPGGGLTYEQIIARLEEQANPANVAGMARFGITPRRAYGVPMPILRDLAREAGRDQALTLRLWAADWRETRLLASLVADPGQVDEAQADAWVAEFDYWEICDQFCINLFERCSFAYPKAHEWSLAEAEFVKRTGFVLMARLAVADKRAGPEPFEEFLLAVQREAGDNRPAVRKAVNWALRQIGKRSPALNTRAVTIAREIQQLKLASALWIAADALRELTSEAVQARLAKRHGGGRKSNED